jgi:DnaK suppressor protein
MNLTYRGVSLSEAYERTSRRVNELTGVLDSIAASSDAANIDDEHDPEGATIGFERAQVLALLARARAHLTELDEASERVRLGTYGTCERCRAQIPEERLDAQPAARTCVTCAAL